jgi:hypothetical protein
LPLTSSSLNAQGESRRLAKDWNWQINDVADVFVLCRDFDGTNGFDAGWGLLGI